MTDDWSSLPPPPPGGVVCGMCPAGNYSAAAGELEGLSPDCAKIRKIIPDIRSLSIFCPYRQCPIIGEVQGLIIGCA